jgi:AraC-like DNA-binding protein
MLKAFLFFLTAFVGCLLFFLLQFKFKKSSVLINRYLKLTLINIIFRYTLYGISQFVDHEIIFIFSKLGELFSLNIIPCSFLYFREVLNKEKWTQKDMNHFIAPNVILVFSIITFGIHNESGLKLGFVSLNMMATCMLLGYYAKSIFDMLNVNFLQKKQSEITHPKAIKYWLLFLSIMLFLIALRIVVGFYIRITSNVFDPQNMELIWVSAFLWLAIFTRIIISPEILYGFNVQTPVQHVVYKNPITERIFEVKEKETVKENEPVKEIDRENDEKLSFNCWSNLPLKEISNPNDIKLYANIEDKLSGYFKKIDAIFLQYEVACKNDFDLEMLASMVKIPISHVKFIFKYCSQSSFINYRKKIQINFATILIKSGYLKRNTLDSLSKYVGFSSYTPFYYAFKEIMGISPQDF